MILTEGNTLSTINNTKSVVRPITAPPAPKTKDANCHSNEGDETVIDKLSRIKEIVDTLS